MLKEQVMKSAFTLYLAILTDLDSVQISLLPFKTFLNEVNDNIMYSTDKDGTANDMRR